MGKDNIVEQVIFTEKSLIMIFITEFIIEKNK